MSDSNSKPDISKSIISAIKSGNITIDTVINAMRLKPNFSPKDQSRKKNHKPSLPNNQKSSYSSIRINKINGIEYLQAITYESHPRLTNHQHIKILKSFGKKSPENHIESQIFLKNYNFMIDLLRDSAYQSIEDQALIKKICMMRLGNILGLEVIDYLFFIP